MSPLLRSHFTAAVVGGLVVAGTFVVVGIAGRQTTHTVIVESTVAGRPGDGDEALTPHGIYMRDAPGVVFVKAQVVQQVTDPFELAPVRRQSNSTGSGFLISSTGFILTNYHVVQGADPHSGVIVDFEDDIARPAEVVGEDRRHDLALLKVDMAGIPGIRPLALGDSTTVKVGDPTLAIGNPFGYDRTLTSGIVSALQRQIQAPDGFAINNVIQTDAPINPGNSGGPLIDADGRVIGINSQIATGAAGGRGSIGIAFAVPIDTAKAFIPRVESHPTPIATPVTERRTASRTGVRPGLGIRAVLHESGRTSAPSRTCRDRAGALRCGRGSSRPQDQVLRDYRSR